jgi:hypothetical protein
LDKNIPGPGRYEIEKPLGFDSSKYSFSKNFDRFKISNQLLNTCKTGFGKCTSLEIKSTGKYPISRFRNTTNSIDWDYYKLKRIKNNGILN